MGSRLDFIFDPQIAARPVCDWRFAVRIFQYMWLRRGLMNRTLTLGQRLSRLRTRLAAPEWRRYGGLLLSGKFGAIGLLVIAALLFKPELMGLSTYAADPVLKGNDI